MSTRNHLFIMAILSMLLIDPTQAALALKNKPQPPVQVTIAPSQPSQATAAIKPGDEVTIKITAQPSVDATEMRILTTLGDGVELVSGALEWSGPARKGEEQIITMIVRSPLHGKGKIASLVEIYAENVLLISTKTEYDLDRRASEKPQQPIGTRKDKKGQRVDEYR